MSASDQISANKVVLVTGALTGIGRATAELYARDGATVVVSGRRPEEGERLAAHLRTLGAADAVFIQADVRREDDVRALTDDIVRRFGRLDIAVNNAGTEGTPGPTVDQSTDTLAAVFDTNVAGVVLSLKHELRVMAPAKRGAIVNISSVYGHAGAAGAGIYVASKHAVEGLTKSAALEAVASGVRVNAVAPGPIETGMLDRFTGGDTSGFAQRIPLRRIGRPEEIAAAVKFLASDEASFIVGQSLIVDGGITAG